MGLEMLTALAMGQAEGRRRCEILQPDGIREAAAARAVLRGWETPGFPLKEREFLIISAVEARLENACSGARRRRKIR